MIHFITAYSSLANVSWPCLPFLLVWNAETKNDIFLCWLTSSSSSLKTKEHLKVVGWRHILVFKCLFQRTGWSFLVFFFFRKTFPTFAVLWYTVEMSDHYSANANLSGWMWRLKPKIHCDRRSESLRLKKTYNVPDFWDCFFFMYI